MSETEQTAAGEAAADVQASAHEGNSADAASAQNHAQDDLLAPHEVSRVQAAMDIARQQADNSTDLRLAALEAEVEKFKILSATAAVEARAAGVAARTAGPQLPTIGRIVIVREPHHPDYPAIIAEVLDDLGTIHCNVFRGTHIPHALNHLPNIDPKADGPGWFWPARA